MYYELCMLNDINNIYNAALEAYNKGLWGIVIPSDIYDYIYTSKETVEDEHKHIFDINVILDDSIVHTGAHCMFIDKELGLMLLHRKAGSYEQYSIRI